ncbi:hypothetical protein D3C85_1773280 [compost metagenome]
MMVIWKKSVSATDHMPPNRVYTSTMAEPISMPCVVLMLPSDSTLNTTPSAVSCAAIQPR